MNVQPVVAIEAVAYMQKPRDLRLTPRFSAKPRINAFNPFADGYPVKSREATVVGFKVRMKYELSTSHFNDIGRFTGRD